MLTVGSLFSGIGGMELGLERAGMTVRWQVENDPYCTKVLAKHWPDVTRYGDIKEIDWGEVEPVDLICGGFPCQPVSHAGKRKGDKDDRWLWPEFLRCVRSLKPRWVLVENVVGLLSADAGRLFAGILRDLAASGYDAEWDCIPAAAVGAPHRRDRVWLVAHSHDGRHLHGQVGVEPAEAGFDALGQPEPSRQDVADAAQLFGYGGDHNGRGRPRSLSESGNGGQGQRPLGSWWSTEPNVGRVAHGVPSRVDRLRGLGNAVVPQVVEWIGRRILEVADV